MISDCFTPGGQNSCAREDRRKEKKKENLRLVHLSLLEARELLAGGAHDGI
jgi:hypothetical protein